MLIPHSRPYLDNSDSAAVASSVKTHHITQGKSVERFEEAMAEYIGVKSAAAVNSGTSALHLGLLALGVRPGDEVILPSYVCIAPLNAVCYCGATPKLCDINKEDFNISAKEIKKKINKKTKAVIVPHMFGMPADLDDLLKLGVPVIEDCAHSIGAEYKNKKVGSFGRLSIFSFYATKMLACGEGGMVCSDLPVLINKIKDLREYDKKDKFSVRFNYKMTDIQASLGLSQLSKLNMFIKRRKELASGFNACFSGSRTELPVSVENKKPVFYRYVVRIKADLDKTIKCAQAYGLSCRRPVHKPIHRYLREIGFPNTEQAWKTALSIPLFPSLTEAEAGRIRSFIRKHLAFATCPCP